MDYRVTHDNEEFRKYAQRASERPRLVSPFHDHRQLEELEPGVMVTLLLSGRELEGLFYLRWVVEKCVKESLLIEVTCGICTFWAFHSWCCAG